jgi:hypothetical protein
MENQMLLWLEDQHEDFDTYKSELYRSGYLLKVLKSVSEMERSLQEKDYVAAIFDIKVLPGDSEKWITLDKEKRKENPNFDSYLGLELLHALFNSPKARVKIDPPITIDPYKIIVFSVVTDKSDEISVLGIPKDQIIYKSNADLSTLPRLVKKIQERK